MDPRSAGIRPVRRPSPRAGVVGILVLGAAVALAWVDARPGWDDSGITVFSVLFLAAAGALAGLPPWISGALTCVPLLVAELPRGTAALIAVPLALAGGFVGAYVRGAVNRK